MKAILAQKIENALRELQEAGALPAFVLPEIRVERPKDEQFGEYTSNIALVSAKPAGKNPAEIAELLRDKLASEEFEKIEVAKPGHLNFSLSQKVLGSVVERIGEEGDAYGASTIGQGVKVNNEFISANPTGPMHLGNGRGGFYADALGRVLAKAGFQVTNEYYVNDAGEQILKLAQSVLGTSKAVYAGEYIEELREKFKKEQATEESWLGLVEIAEHDEDASQVYEFGKDVADEVLSSIIQPTLEKKMRIHFDVFTSERRDVIEKSYIDKAIEIFEEKGLIYEEDGAKWLKTTEFGDDKNRVLVKSDGTRTYFASDCGYIFSKMDRGFTRIIETWGADHHGYVGRFRAAAQALGFSGNVDFILVQLVQLMKDGQEVRMSKRAGNVVTIDELIERVGHDVTRFFFLQYAPETHMTFDLGLAEERSQKNPVFYVQYAHARLASVLEKGKAERLALATGNLGLLTHEKERELLRELLAFPELVESIAEDLAPHRLPQYAIRLADKLHSFYDVCLVVNKENKDLSEARLALVLAVKTVLKETLSLMGIAAPEKM
ncbi:MAG: arginine--tRNA ligase [Candidatus Moranbacteria bacterium RIFCSPHIGHO2_01_FULL_55_24]|nr:MAG: arginine--tRNA ligase [Candidatus Moranbacteria bacterium RIFCSPHIGHO2_01_FULL_55_24]